MRKTCRDLAGTNCGGGGSVNRGCLSYFVPFCSVVPKDMEKRTPVKVSCCCCCCCPCSLVLLFLLLLLLSVLLSLLLLLLSLLYFLLSLLLPLLLLSLLLPLFLETRNLCILSNFLSS